MKTVATIAAKKRDIREAKHPTGHSPTLLGGAAFGRRNDLRRLAIEGEKIPHEKNREQRAVDQDPGGKKSERPGEGDAGEVAKKEWRVAQWR